MNILNYHLRKNLPAISVVILLLVIQSCKDFRQRLPFRRHSLNDAFEWAKKDSVRVADSMKKVMLEKKAFKRTMTDSLMSIEDKDFLEGPTTPHYYIIIGSFTNHDNAKQAAELYSRHGHKTKIIKITGNDGTSLELVSVNAFSDHEKASLFLKEIKGKYVQHAWIYTEK